MSNRHFYMFCSLCFIFDSLIGKILKKCHMNLINLTSCVLLVYERITQQHDIFPEQGDKKS